MHQASGAGKRKSPKRFCPLTSVLIGDTEIVFRTRFHTSRQQFPSLFDARSSSMPARPSLMAEAARKPASKPISVSPCLLALRVDRPEAAQPARAAPK